MKKQCQRLVNEQNKQHASRQRHSREFQELAKRHGSNRGAVGAKKLFELAEFEKALNVSQGNPGIGVPQTSITLL